MNEHDFDQRTCTRAQNEAFPLRSRYEDALTQTLGTLSDEKVRIRPMRSRTLLIVALVLVAMAGTALAGARLGLMDYLRALWIAPQGDVSHVLHGLPQQTGGDTCDARYTVEEAFWDGKTLMALVRVVAIDGDRFVLMGEGENYDEYAQLSEGQQKETLMVGAPLFEQVNGREVALGSGYPAQRDAQGALTYLISVPAVAQQGEDSLHVQMRVDSVPVGEEDFDWEAQHFATLEFVVPKSAATQVDIVGPFDLGTIEIRLIHLTHTPLGLQVETIYVPQTMAEGEAGLAEDGKVDFAFMSDIANVTLPDGKSGFAMSQTFTTAERMPDTLELLYSDSERMLCLDTKAKTAQIITLTPDQQAAMYEGK